MNEIATDEAPASIGPFSQAIRDGDRLYVSGQGPVDPESGEIVANDIESQTHAVMENLETVLEPDAAPSRTSSSRRCSSPTWTTTRPSTRCTNST